VIRYRLIMIVDVDDPLAVYPCFPFAQVYFGVGGVVTDQKAEEWTEPNGDYWAQCPDQDYYYQCYRQYGDHE